MKLNAQKFRDRLYACWIGKNIGGTMGTPYEGGRKMLNIQGFVTKPNEVLPNDDLDLQLVWLHAVENIGPYGLDCKKLGEFWCSFIVPYWNEYGIGKTNMQRGIYAPLSGDYMNPWKHSNGAWIRTEIWASLAPACPEIAARYAIEDAKVDHGAGEGTIAAAFVAAMQSAAYAVSDVRTCIEIGLTQVPEQSRLALSVKKVIECFDAGMSAEDCRNTILSMNSDIGDGWFESPSNVAYTVLGLLYGKGDFKKSMITAINCGDDTDCTGATVGATLGIIYGTAGIPADWKAYLGDDIITVSLNRASGLRPPKNCTELTDRVLVQTPLVLGANHANVSITEGKEEIPKDIAEQFKNNQTTKTALENLVPYSFTTEMAFCTVTAAFERSPDIQPGESIKVKLTFRNNFPIYGNSPYHLAVRWLLPEGFTVSGKTNIRLPHMDAHDPACIEEVYTLTAGEKVESVNRCVAEVTATGRPTAAYVSLVLFG